MARSRLKKKTIGDIIFESINTIIMLILVFLTLYPMYYVVCASFSNNVELLANPGVIWYPRVSA